MNLPALLSLYTLALSVFTAAAHVPWNNDYSSLFGPLFWGNHDEYKTCGMGREQSPINIRRSATVYRDFPPLAFNFTDEYMTFKIGNKGTSPAAYPKDNVVPILTGGPLGDAKYRVYNVHLHYGNSSLKASEHAYDGVRTTGEFHVVTYNTKYISIGQALASGKRDALAVVGVLFEARNVSNIDVGTENLIRLASNVTYKGDFYYTALNFDELILDTDMDYYYSYDGSLTTPTCDEVVNWIVIDRVHYVRYETIDLLSGLWSGDRDDPSIPIKGNTRPLQKLYGRQVLRSFSPDLDYMLGGSGSVSLTAYLSTSLLTILAFVAASIHP